MIPEDSEANEYSEEVAVADQIYNEMLIYDKYLDGPKQQEQSFFSQLFKNLQINTMSISKNYLKIGLQPRRRKNVSTLDSKSIESDHEFSDTTMKEGLIQINNQIMQKYPKFIKTYYEKIETPQQNVITYDNYLKNKNPNQLFWVSRVPYREIGLSFETITFSKSLIEIFGYTMEEAALHFRRYHELSINFTSNDLYKQSTIKALKLMEELINLDEQTMNKQSVDQIVRKYRYNFDNEMVIGKNNNKIIAQMTVHYITPFFLQFHIDKILKRQIIEGIQTQRQIVQENFHKNLFASLSSIYRLPKTMNPENHKKICSYVEIKKTQNNSQQSPKS